MPGHALRPICHRRKARSTSTSHAPAWATPRKRRSAKKSHGEGAPATAPGVRAPSSVFKARRLPASWPRSLHVLGGLLHDRRQAGGKRDVAHLPTHLLSLREAVGDELAQGGRLLRVRVLLVEQEPRVRRDGIGLRAFRVRQPGPQVGGQLHAGQRFLPALPTGRDVLPCLVLQARHLELGELAKGVLDVADGDRKSTRLNSSHVAISYAVFCLKKKNKPNIRLPNPHTKKNKHL